MLFNSLQFLVFFPIVVLLYWMLPPKMRNTMLLVASYYFYMNWQPVYALLILFSTLTTWAGALYINNSGGKRRKWALWLTILLNLGILFTYKYLGFAGNEVKHLLDVMGLGIEIPKFELLLPVGISFYTFQAVGYLVDVYRRNLKAERNPATYALFVAFFPQLVAGPIERAKNLLAQFHTRHHFSSWSLTKGLELMVMGYFMKLCVAENLAPYVNAVFNNMPQHNGTSILLASVFFTFQIFCDFGGYSLIAIGAARCMDFRLMQNFRQPYLATSVKDFWRRWHISLSSWFNDYVYIPLGGNRVSRPRHYFNLFTTFLVSGIWHGANYTYILWGAYHGVLQCIHTTFHPKKPKGGVALVKGRVPRAFNPLLTVINILTVFLLIVAGLIIFRANNIADAWMAFKKIATDHGTLYNGAGKPSILLSCALIVLLMTIEIIRERQDRHKASTEQYPHETTTKGLMRSALFTAFLIIVILLTAQFSAGQFIYFQF